MTKKDFVLKILEIINFQEDPENFVTDFLETAKKRTAAKIAENQIDLGDNDLIEKYLDEEFLNLIQDWLTSIKSSLNTDQIHAIQNLSNQHPTTDSF